MALWHMHMAAWLLCACVPACYSQCERGCALRAWTPHLLKEQNVGVLVSNDAGQAIHPVLQGHVRVEPDIEAQNRTTHNAC